MQWSDDVKLRRLIEDSQEGQSPRDIVLVIKAIWIKPLEGKLKGQSRQRSFQDIV